MNDLRAIIPAAGKGSRLQKLCGDVPKAMFCVGKRPMLEYVLENTSFINSKNTYIVVGYGKEKIIEYFGGDYCYIEQKQQLGTGHAVMECAEEFKGFDTSSSSNSSTPLGNKKTPSLSSYKLYAKCALWNSSLRILI